jgi:hypothetical protein
MPKGELASLVELTKTKPHLRIVTVGAVPTLVHSTSFLVLFDHVMIDQRNRLFLKNVDSSIHQIYLECILYAVNFDL